MFTGLVQRVGEFSLAQRRNGGALVKISSAKPWPEPIEKGESIAVQGVCLTVVDAFGDAGDFTADALEETLACSTLGSLRAGAKVNLERALRPMDRMGGHIVSGHVDGVGTVAEIRGRGQDMVMKIDAGGQDLGPIVRKGSIAVDGVSLTVSAAFPDGSFEVNLIPTTLRDTSLSALKAGDAVNLETDVIGKYVRDMISRGGDSAAGAVTLDKLISAGF